MRGRIVNCEKHPTSEVIASCPLCGRGFCENCQVNVMNVPHCKECAEWILFQTLSAIKTQFPLPIPRGTPRRDYFIVGGIGSIITLIFAFFIGYFFFYNFSFYGYYMDDFTMLFALGCFFTCGLIATALGFYGFYHNYGSIMGLVTFVFSLICSAIFIISLYMAVFDSRFGGSFGAEYIISAISVGVCLGLMGVTLLIVKNFTMQSTLSAAAGIFTILVAILFGSIFMALFFGIAWFLLMVACLLIAVMFFLAKLPPVHSGQLQSEVPGITISSPIGIKHNFETKN